MSGVDVAVAPPTKPIISAGTPGHQGPSIREATIAATQAFGPKTGHHVPAAQLAAAHAGDGGVAEGVVGDGLRPSIRESTIAMTEKFGPKAPNHVPPSELPKSQTTVPQVDRPARYPEGPIQKPTPQSEAPATETAVAEAAAVVEPAAAADAAPLESAAPAVEAPQPATAAAEPAGPLPSVRESTIAMTEQHGPKVGHHVPPSELPASQTALPVVERPVPHQRQAAVASPIAAAIATAVAPLSSAVAEAPVPAAAELAIRDVDGRLPSVRESTIAMTKKYGPKQPNHVPPSELNRPQAVANTASTNGGGGEVVSAASQARARTENRQHAVAIQSAKAPHRVVGNSNLLAKPVREWGSAEVKQAATQVMENKVVMTALAVGAAALTVFSIYKGVEMYNHYRLGQSIAEVEREQPAVVHLYIHRRSPLAPSVSIPCTRVETLLRLLRVPYEAHVISDPSVSPNGELPFIVFNGLRIAGAHDITDALARELDASLDRDLSREDQATGVALLSAVQYSLTRGYLRSVHVDRPEVMQPYYSEMNRTPDWVTRFALRRLQRRISTVNDTSGYGQLSSAQYVHELLRDVRAVEALLEHQTYLFSSDYPSSYDCALYAWLLPVVAMEDAAEVNEAFAYIVESELITNYVRRMTELAFPDLDELVYGQLDEESEEEEKEEEEGAEGERSHRGLTSEDEQASVSREGSHAPGSSAKRTRGRTSEHLRRTAGVADAAEGDAVRRPSQHEVKLPGES